MDEALAWLLGVIVVVGLVIAAIVWVVMMTAILLYTTLAWTANAILAGLEIMLSFGDAVPAWVGWMCWGAVLGSALGYASSAAGAPHRRPVAITPLLILVAVAVGRNLL